MNMSKWQVKLFIKIIIYPILITLTSFIPKLNFEILFSHGGIGWWLVALSFPWVIGILIVNIKKQSKGDIQKDIISGIVFMSLYLILSYPLVLMFQKGISTAGFAMELKDAWKFYIFPISLLW